MNLAFILLLVISSQPSFGNVCTEEYNRLPVNADIAVTCGPSNIQLSIKVCPVYHANFDPYELALNGKHNNTACIGTLDNSNDTPLLNFTVLLDDSSSNVCGNMIEILNEVGTGTFSSYSNIETVVISGFIDSLPVSEMGLISYSTNLHYNFSCHYPLQYLLNNTEILTSFGSVAVNSNNGSFISTLRMEIFTQCTSSRRKRDVNADRTTGPDPVVVSFGPVYVTVIMKTAVIVLFGLMTQKCLGDLNCSDLYNRYPANSDLTVTCGPTGITLSIIACPIQYAMFDPAALALNGKHSLNNCAGTLDTSVQPAVVNFNFSINDTTQNSCGNLITIQEDSGTGDFSQYSKIQTVVISGYLDTPVTTDTNLISYSTNLNYSFSCYYPLQYLMSNIELLTSSANVAVNTNNGSFISTLSMQLYDDANFTTLLQFNGTTLPLKKNVYVQVAATNLTANFNVLLDECFATPSPLTTTNVNIPLLTGCSTGNRTTLITNGQGKSAKFSFETFRFLQHSNQLTSTIYIHCITRLCQPQTCFNYLQTCNSSTPTPTVTAGRRRRAAEKAVTGGATEQVTVSSGPIVTSDTDGSEVKQLEGTLTGLIVGLVVAIILGAALAIASFILYKMSKLRASESEKKGVDNFTFNGK
ncbi:zona pellucida-like domain-containing protein 1 [Mantella aurantiaca]